MTDIHTHVLPGLDDGAGSMAEALNMLAVAAESGVTALVATPHCIPGVYENYADEELLSLWEELRDRARAERIPVKLCRGMEVFATEALPALLEQGRVWTLNDTRYFLMEFAFDEDPAFCREILRHCRALGYTPVIAHPERYYFVQDDPELAFAWCVSGSVLQLNKGSLLGRFGRQPFVTAQALLRHGLAACVASDAHGAVQRSPDMTQLEAQLLDDYGQSYTHLLLEENPQRILAGRELLGYEPIPFR